MAVTPGNIAASACRDAFSAVRQASSSLIASSRSRRRIWSCTLVEIDVAWITPLGGNNLLLPVCFVDAPQNSLVRIFLGCGRTRRGRAFLGAGGFLLPCGSLPFNALIAKVSSGSAQVRQVQMEQLRHADERINRRYGKSAPTVREQARRTHTDITELAMGTGVN